MGKYPRETEGEVPDAARPRKIFQEDMDAMMKAIQEAYWIAKEKNRKYVPKKYRGISGDSSNS